MTVENHVFCQGMAIASTCTPLHHLSLHLFSPMTFLKAGFIRRSAMAARHGARSVHLTNRSISPSIRKTQNTSACVDGVKRRILKRFWVSRDGGRNLDSAAGISGCHGETYRHARSLLRLLWIQRTSTTCLSAFTHRGDWKAGTRGVLETRRTGVVHVGCS